MPACFLCSFYSGFMCSFMQEIFNLKFQNNVSFTSESFFVFIGLFLLCSVVDKWLEKYGYNRRQDIQQRNTSQNAAPRNSISGISSLLLSVCIWRYS